MAENTLKITYKIFMESEDISQTRILSCAKYLKDILKNHKNVYISRAAVDDESDMEDFVLRLFVEETIEEDVCKNPEAATQFIDDMVELLLETAHMHSYMDLEGEFGIEYLDEKKNYSFCSEGGDSFCDFEEK